MIDLPSPYLPGLERVDFSSSQATYDTASIPKCHPINVGSNISDPWRNSTFNKGNSPGHAHLASPIDSLEATSGGDATDEPRELDAHLWFLNLDTIRITFAPEKEGIFIFKHTNYVVGSKVPNISGAANSMQVPVNLQFLLCSIRTANAPSFDGTAIFAFCWTSSRRDTRSGCCRNCRPNDSVVGLFTLKRSLGAYYSLSNPVLVTLMEHH